MMDSEHPASQLKVTYDKAVDILWIRIPGRKIKRTDAVITPLVIDFGSDEDTEEGLLDVVGVEIRNASKHLSPMLEALGAEKQAIND